MKVAVVGGGASGLAAAYVLAKDGVEVVVYEKEDEIGGQAKSVTVDGTIIDLSFMDFSQVTHLEVIELFEELGVDQVVSNMSFSVSLEDGLACEWGTNNGLSSLLAQKKNVLNPFFWKMIQEVLKFKKAASTYIEELENNQDIIDRSETLEHFLQSNGYSDFFQKAFLIPTCASLWSCSPPRVMNLPAYFVLSFLRNHPIFQLFGYPQKQDERWSSQSYVNMVKKELENKRCKLRTNAEVLSISTIEEGCVVKCKDDENEEIYDNCIIATHAPDAVEILGKQVEHDELRILNAFHYAYSDIFLHHDSNLMPKNPSIWGSRNFIKTTEDEAYTTYWLNNFQKIGKDKLPFLLTLNAPHVPKSTVFKWSTSWSIPTVAASKALSEIKLIQGKRGLWFCGSYLGYGFLEDSVKAGIFAANGLLGKSVSMQNVINCMILSWPETVARLLVTRFFQQFITIGCLILIEVGGGTFAFKGTTKQSALKATLKIHNPQFYWKVATEADIGFADAYINGNFSFVDKNEGLLNCIQIFIANEEMYTKTSKSSKKRGWWTPILYTSIVASAKYFFKHVARQNTLSRARRNISEHYDLSNELFSSFLDETMTYSCAIFQNPDEDLKTAQLRKVHTLIKKARICKEHHVLEIGCGWGSLAFEVVKLIGCKYTGITLSEKQVHYVDQKVKEAGLEDQIELILCDYRELPKGHKYDRIISCGMIESVGHEYMGEFFKCCESALGPNGVLVLQFISIADAKYSEYQNSPGFIKEYIFPGGCIPSLNHVISSMAIGSKLSLVHLEEIGCHYFYTLRCWREKFLRNRREVLDLGFDEKFIRTWEYYFDYCAAGFKLGAIGDYQIVLIRPGDVATFENDPYNPVPTHTH